MDTRTHVLYVSARASGDYLHIVARVMGWDGATDTIRNLRTDDTHNCDPLAGIVATAQGDRDQDRAYTYGWTFGLMTDTADVLTLAAATASLRTLTRASRKLDAVASAYGPAATFGAQCARIASALGLRIVTGTAGADGMYTSGRYVTWAPGDAVSVIDGWYAQHRAR